MVSNAASRSGQIPLGVDVDDDDDILPAIAAAPTLSGRKSAHQLEIENAQLKAELVKSNMQRNEDAERKRQNGALQAFMDWEESHIEERGKLLKIFAFFAVVVLMTAIILSIPAPECKRISRLPIHLKKKFTLGKAFEIRFVFNRKSNTNGHVLTLSRESGVDGDYRNLQNAIRIFLTDSSLTVTSIVNGRQTNVFAMQRQIISNTKAHVAIVVSEQVLSATIANKDARDGKLIGPILAEATSWVSETYNLEELLLLDHGMRAAELTDLRIGTLPSVAHSVKSCFTYG